MKNSELSASMMCADLARLRETFCIFEREGIEHLHIDVMDGVFVPNLGFGTDDIRNIRSMTGIPLDLHLMVQSPAHKLKWFDIQPDDMVSIHYESAQQIEIALDLLGRYGCRRFLAISPATSILALESVLDAVDGVNLLAVDPGFAGQKMAPGSLQKAEALQTLLRDRGKKNILIEVDGNITPEHGAQFRMRGANIFVAGSSSIYRGGLKLLGENIRRLREAVS